MHEVYKPCAAYACHSERGKEGTHQLLPLLLYQHPPKIVISTEAMDSSIVRRAVERPPHFAFAVAFQT
jgi:hypothetical protein